MKNVSTNHKSNHDKSHIEFEQKIKPPTTTKKKSDRKKISLISAQFKHFIYYKDKSWNL